LASDIGSEIGTAAPENLPGCVSQNRTAKLPADLSQKEQFKNYSQKPWYGGWS
jgi:hypothetical protein